MSPFLYVMRCRPKKRKKTKLLLKDIDFFGKLKSIIIYDREEKSMDVKKISSVSYEDYQYTRLAQDLLIELGEKIQKLHSRAEYKRLKKRLEQAIGDTSYGGQKKYDSHVQQIYTALYNLFADACGEESVSDLPIQINRQNAKTVLERLKNLSLALKTQEEIDQQFLEEVYKVHAEYKHSKDYMRRLVIARLQEISPEFVSQFEDGKAVVENGRSVLRDDIDSISTRLLILKQFVKQFGWCEGVKGDDSHGRGFECLRLKEWIGERDFGQAAEELTEDVFDRLVEIRSETRSMNAEQNNLQLVNIAKDLGAGHFQKNKNNREPLYIFAIAFEMTLSFKNQLPCPGDENYMTDIRKNLFFDFYTDNLINKVEGGDTKKEKDISGYGINYRNYAEAAYLRSICASGSALEKLREASEIISRCESSEEARSLEYFESFEERPEEFLANRRTEYHRNALKRHLKDNVDDFCRFLLEDYVCRSSDGERRYKFGSDPRTATAMYAALTGEKVKAIRQETGLLKSNAWRTGVAVPPDCSPEEKEKRKAFNAVLGRYADLINRENRMMKCYEDPDTLQPQDLKGINDTLDILRSDLLIAALYYLIAVFDKDPAHFPVDRLDNFEVFYNYLTQENVIRGKHAAHSINSILLKCGFMEINPKNVFDLFVLYETYQIMIGRLHLYEKTVNAKMAP